MSGTTDLLLKIERLTQENDRLRAENSALRPLVSELQHKLRIAETTPRPDASKVETAPITRKSREHA